MMTFNLHLFVASLVYATLGIVIFFVAFKLAQRFLPFDIVKELVEDDNVAVGIVMASVILGLAIIIASAIHG
jgi:putative membrane protein